MDLSDMTNEQLTEGLAAAREAYQAADRLVRDYLWERRNRADAEFERRLDLKREAACRRALDVSCTCR